jgi:hypothetical protein
LQCWAITTWSGRRQLLNSLEMTLSYE